MISSGDRLTPIEAAAPSPARPSREGRAGVLPTIPRHLPVAAVREARSLI